jgi:hypothetical protein
MERTISGLNKQPRLRSVDPRRLGTDTWQSFSWSAHSCPPARLAVFG